MANTFLVCGLIGFIFCTAFQSRADQLIHLVSLKVQDLFRPKHSFSDDLPLITRLLASTRAGISLDSALEQISGEVGSPDIRARIQEILLGRPRPDFLSTFLHGALSTGIPVLAPLQAFQKILQIEKKVRLKARSLTSQSRAQGEVLSWMPWMMAIALAVIDSDWLLSAMSSSGSWLLWAIALTLLGAGRAWMKALLGRALKPSGNEEYLREELLPKLCLRLIAELSLGQDAESALEKALAQINNGELALQFANEKVRGEGVRALHALLHHAALTGAPLRDDLMAHLSDLHLQMESRWEERVQRLPVVMMAPLFLCFFPSSLLVLAGLLFPLIAEVL